MPDELREISGIAFYKGTAIRCMQKRMKTERYFISDWVTKMQVTGLGKKEILKIYPSATTM